MFHPHTSNLLLRAELHILFTCFSEGNFFLSAYSTHLYPNFTLYSEIFKKNKGHEGCCYFFFFSSNEVSLTPFYITEFKSQPEVTAPQSHQVQNC